LSANTRSENATWFSNLQPVAPSLRDELVLQFLANTTKPGSRRWLPGYLLVRQGGDFLLQFHFGGCIDRGE
jgi:hypothetical protein